MTKPAKNKLPANVKAQNNPWVKHMGKLKHLQKETERIDRLTKEQSVGIDPETWH